jgi:hypothetical protein
MPWLIASCFFILKKIEQCGYYYIERDIADKPKTLIVWLKNTLGQGPLNMTVPLLFFFIKPVVQIYSDLKSNHFKCGT